MIRKWSESVFGAVKKRVGRTVARNKGISSFFRLQWIEFLYLVGIIVMAAGIVNAAIQPVDVRFVIFPGRGAQSISETVINALALLLGAGGIYLSYLSGRQTTKPRMVNFYLALGLLLIAIGMYMGIYVYSAKA